MFSAKDLKFFKSKAIDVEKIEAQIEIIKKGKQYIKAERAATVGDGIYKADQDEIKELVEFYEEQSVSLDIAKFVPASGAATRMFKRLITLRESYKGSPDEFIEVNSQKDFYGLKNTFENLSSFAFYPELFKSFFRREQSLERYMRKNEYEKIADMILGKRGLNYAEMPKGLVLFHKYAGHARTAFDEHLVEGVSYCKGKDEVVNLHFTIQGEFEKHFEKRFKYALKTFLSADNLDMNVEFSEQSESTSSIALDSDFNVLRDDKKQIVLRPGGHGALIENLNDIDSDIVFIKNIDNVAPDSHKDQTIKCKKYLGGYLLRVRNQIFDILNILDQEQTPSDDQMNIIFEFVSSILPHVKFSENKERAIVELKYCLNRPIRICGMVENTSEPGGGPFWVKDENDNLYLQILEKSQIDLDNNEQVEIMEHATHFNPVDLVCSVKNYKGQKFNLLNYRDENSGFVVEKSFNGKTIHSYELPGLWNGAMSNWITIFAEVPLITFNPVKELNDLLRVEHQTAK